MEIRQKSPILIDILICEYATDLRQKDIYPDGAHIKQQKIDLNYSYTEGVTS